MDVGEVAMTEDSCDGVMRGLGAYCESSDFSTCITGSGGGGGGGDAWLGGGGRSAVPIGDNIGGGGGSLMCDFDGGTWDALYNRDDSCSGWW